MLTFFIRFLYKIRMIEIKKKLLFLLNSFKIVKNGYNNKLNRKKC